MHGKGNHIDDLFRNGFKGLRHPAPSHAWNRLDEALDARKYGSRMLIFRLVAASVLILLAFGAGYYFAIYNTSQNRDNLTNNGTVPIQIPESGEQPPDVAIPQPHTGEILPGEDFVVAQEDPEMNKRTADPSTPPLLPESRPEAETPAAGSVYGGQPIYKINPVFLTSLDVKLVPEKAATRGTEKKGYALPEPYPIYDYTENKRKPGQQSYKWSVGAQFAPTYSYREISANYGTGATGNPMGDEDLNAVEDPLLSYAGGLQVDYKVSGNWRLESGVYFSRIGQVNNDALEFKQGNNEFLLTAINTSTGGINVAYDRVPDPVKRINAPKDTIPMAGVENAKIVQQFDLFEIPFLLKYKMLNRKFSMHVAGGLSPAYLVGNNTYLEYEERKYDVGDAGNLNSMIVNTSLGVGFEYLITKKLSVNLEPTFKYALNPINNNSNFSYHPYYFSWFTGIRMRIY